MLPVLVRNSAVFPRPSPAGPQYEYSHRLSYLNTDQVVGSGTRHISLGMRVGLYRDDSQLDQASDTMFFSLRLARLARTFNDGHKQQDIRRQVQWCYGSGQGRLGLGLGW